MPRKSKGEILCGEIIAYNINGSGEADGVLLDADGASAQVNFPEGHKASLGATLQIGQRVELLVEKLQGAADHPVFGMSGTMTSAEGTVVRLNYARDGGINGYQLDTGVLIYVGARRRRSSPISVGDRVTARGVLRIGARAPVLDTDAAELLVTG